MLIETLTEMWGFFDYMIFIYYYYINELKQEKIN
jgi:hypothetical protein